MVGSAVGIPNVVGIRNDASYFFKNDASYRDDYSFCTVSILYGGLSHLASIANHPVVNNVSSQPTEQDLSELRSMYRVPDYVIMRLSMEKGKDRQSATWVSKLFLPTDVLERG